MSKGRSVFSLRWAMEYPAILEFLGMIEEKIDATCRRLRCGPFEIERIQVAVLSVCQDVIVTLLKEDETRMFRVDMTVLGNQVHVKVSTQLEPFEIPEDAAVGEFKPYGQTARMLDLGSLTVADERLDEVMGEIQKEGKLTLSLTRILPDELRRDPPIYG